MPGPLSGPGLGLQLPQNLYPTELNAAPYDFSNNRQALAPGQQIPIPAGTWYVAMGLYLVLQYLDPVTGVWSFSSSGAYGRGLHYVKSDGFNFRIANLTGCPCGAVITSTGAGYVQASTTVTVTAASTDSTWQPIVGGQLGFASVVTANAGAGYGVAPIVFIPAPPPAANNANGVGGVQASGFCTIASGTVSGFSFTNPGAGYQTAPVPVLLPNPTDPNINTGITQASLSFSLVTGGGITALLNTNPGTALSNPNSITLTVNGVGSNATVNAVSMQTVTAASVSTGAGTGYGTVSALLTTIGGVPNQGSSITNNPDYLYRAWLPRPAQIGLAVTGAGSLAPQVGSIYDGGLFLTNAVPGYAVAIQTGLAGTGTVNAAAIALTMGGTFDFAILQPAP
jgi:hypothetical protein